MMRIASRVLRDARRQWRRLIRDDKGSIIALAIWLPVLAGAVAIGVQTGELYRVKRQMQGAADAAALAGAVDSMAGRTTSITNDAKYEAQRNGFTDNGGNGVTVTVNAPPSSGPNIRTPNAVEVIIQKQVGFGIGAALLGSTDSFRMTARSVAAQGNYTSTTSSAEGCLVAMTPNNEQGVSFTNFSSFASDCTIVSNAIATGSGTGASVNLSNFSSATLKNIWARGSVTVQNYSSISYLDQNATPPLPRAARQLKPRPSSIPTPRIGPMSLPSGTGNCDYTNYVNAGQCSSTVTAGR